MSSPITLYDKIWNDHIVTNNDDGTSIIYIDRHLVHEVTSPQAFEGLKISGRSVRRPDFTLATADHNIPTLDRDKGITDPESKLQVETLEQNCADHGITYLSMNDMTIEKNIVGSAGGGMYLSSSTIFESNNLTIRGNSADPAQSCVL